MANAPFDAESRACRAAQILWMNRDIKARLQCVRSFRHSLVAAADELTAAVEADVGRPPAEVLGSDVLPLADAARYLEKQAASLLAPRRTAGPPLSLFGQRDWVYRRPWGVVGIIGIWNYPLFLNGVQILQALVAGNGVLWKPSELGGKSAALLVRLLHNAGLPHELVQLLPSTREAGPQLLEADIDHLIFTGSAAVGRQIAKRLGERLIPSTLELSGCDAMFVVQDADVEFAAKAAWFGMTLNRGQTCLAVRRIFVAKSIAPKFNAAMRHHLECAEPLKLATASQVRLMESLIQDAIAKNGDAAKPTLCNGWASDERGAVPHIIFNATPEMAICQVDCFAPVAAVMEFNTIEQALDMESRCSFALGASIFTSDTKTAKHLASQLRAGMVSINDVIANTTHQATPFGGRGSSGWGVTQGAEGLVAMTMPQVVSVRRGRFRPHFDGATPALEKLVRGILNWSHAPRFGQRLRGLWKTIRGLVAVSRGRKKTPGRG
ncbi:MAG: aldehyde dehydrogenase family protein [Gemmataceae bacterium]